MVKLIQICWILVALYIFLFNFSLIYPFPTETMGFPHFCMSIPGCKPSIFRDRRDHQHQGARSSRQTICWKPCGSWMKSLASSRFVLLRLTLQDACGSYGKPQLSGFPENDLGTVDFQYASLLDGKSSGGRKLDGGSSPSFSLFLLCHILICIDCQWNHGMLLG